jgi:spore cortex biosynthesis protein YabQ
MFATAGQAHIFLATVIAGLFTGVLYDLFSVIRKIFNNEASFTGLIDFIFWIAAAAALTIVMVFTGGDGLRGYMLLGFCAGLVLYLVGIHNILKSMVRKVAGFLHDLKRRFVVVANNRN